MLLLLWLLLTLVFLEKASLFSFLLSVNLATHVWSGLISKIGL